MNKKKRFVYGYVRDQFWDGNFMYFEDKFKDLKQSYWFIVRKLQGPITQKLFYNSME